MKLIRLISLALLVGGSLFSASAAYGDDAVYRALASRHPAYNREKLEELAGGADALVARLLELRQDQSLPQVSIRAERLLLDYSDREDVQAALIQDLHSDSRSGLARTIASSVEQVPHSDARKKLAQGVLDRAEQEESFAPYAKRLRESKDPELRKLATESLP